MSKIDFSLNEDQIKALQDRLKGLSGKEQDKVMKTGLKNVAILTHQRLVANVSNRILRRRTGTLAKSVQWRVETSKNGKHAAYIGANVLTGRRVPYANILETGGVIASKRGKFLTVPLPAALTSTGAMKRPSARDYPNTFIARAKSGNLIIFQKRGKSNVVPLFVLKKKVTVRPFRYLSKTLSQVKTRIFQILNATISRELEK